MRKFARAYLYIDKVLDAKLSKAESEERAGWNLEWGTLIMNEGWPEPAVVIFNPASDGSFENGYPKGTVVQKHHGIIADVPDFIRKLRDANQ